MGVVEEVASSDWLEGGGVITSCNTTRLNSGIMDTLGIQDFVERLSS